MQSSKNMWVIGYFYEDPYDASYDHMSEVQIEAHNEDEALSLFHQDYSGCVQYYHKA